MKPLFEIPTKNACVCGHDLFWHCTPGKDGFWIRRGRFRTLLRCQHSAIFATDERATCTSPSCLLCRCPGMPASKTKKKKKVIA